MPHDVTLIATLAAGFVLAFVFGFAASKLRLPPLVGYLLAGVVMGPHTPGIVADAAMAGQLAEIGVILLMFGVGLHFSLADLMAVRRIAIPGRDRTDRHRHRDRRGDDAALGMVARRRARSSACASRSPAPSSC